MFDDADLDRAVAGVVSGIFGSAGQSCVAGSRLFVQKSIYGRFMQALVDRTRQVRVGLPDDPATQMGPLVSRAHRDKVAGYVDIGRAEGGRVLVGGAAPDRAELANGWFYPVSYTHLDVYKRQAPTTASNISLIAPHRAVAGITRGVRFHRLTRMVRTLSIRRDAAAWEASSPN